MLETERKLSTSKLKKIFNTADWLVKAEKNQKG